MAVRVSAIARPRILTGRGCWWRPLLLGLFVLTPWLALGVVHGVYEPWRLKSVAAGHIRVLERQLDWRQAAWEDARTTVARLELEVRISAHAVDLAFRRIEALRRRRDELRARVDVLRDVLARALDTD